MSRNSPVVIDSFVSLDWCILEKPERGRSSQFCELFLMVTHFNQHNQIKTFFSHTKIVRVRHKIPMATFVHLIFDGPMSKIVSNGMTYYHTKCNALVTNRIIFTSICSTTITGWPQTWKTKGIWKIVKISGKTQGNFCRQNLENSGKMKNMWRDRQRKCISSKFSLLSCSERI